MGKKPTILDVAEKANVSVATVSRVINNQGGVRKKTEDDILRAIHELNYVRSQVARSMVRKETKTIGVIIPDICNPFFPEVIAGIEKKAIDKNYFTMLSSSGESLVKEKEIMKHFIERGVDGVVITTADEKGKHLQPLMDANIPVVAVDRMIEEYDVDTVLTGNQEGSYEAVKHLIHLGHKKIAIIRGPQETTPGNERFKGYKKALEEYGLPLKEEWIGEGNFMENSGFSIIHHFHSLKDRPTAVFSCNNLMSIGALKAMRQLNWEVSRDVTFLGFDDVEIATFMKPALTMVTRPKRKIGELAFQLLYERMNAAESDHIPKREYILTPELVIRDASNQVYK
ncbi:LacI family DNA-binding transcriptional regulator [Halobacillus litoralis]|uniref:LacI family DNA-binding transcriptional regulator n=1 Tax=Halobacillus litoralis TaxID=45668 RepID=UPI001CFC4E44|nr:LacI family DNA-binding transcriptional regulator [Halobacillus litoralis]